MRRANHILIIASVFLLTLSSNDLFADLNNNQVIDHEMAQRIESLKVDNGYSSEDFNACQITWTVNQLKKTDPHSHNLLMVSIALE